MSNRTLIEINHDMTHKIEREQDDFISALIAYLRSGNVANANALERFGIRVFGRQRHSYGYAIAWGGRYYAQNTTP